MVAATGQRLPGFHALIDETLASLIRQTPISQRLTDLHEPVAIPAIQPVAPRLTGRVTTHPALIWMMWAAILLSRRPIALVCMRSIVFPTSRLTLHRLR